MSDKTKRVFFGLVSVGIAISTFILADMAMPDEVKWFMRWWLAGVALICYSAGAAYAAYLMHERISEIENGHAEVLKGKQAALDNERRKNAELAARWEKLNSEERRKRETFDVLSEREKWCLAHVWTVFPKKFSISGDLFVSDFQTLVSIGVLRFDGAERHDNEVRMIYTIALEWRRWVTDHADELPEPGLKPPE